MSIASRYHRAMSWLPPAGLFALAACGGDLTVPPATRPITQHVFTLSAMTGTAVNTPSAYDLLLTSEVFTHQTSSFDFAFDIGPDSAFRLGTTGDTIAVLLPRGSLGFTPDGGLQQSPVGLDSIALAPVTGYETLKPTRIRSGDVLIEASRLQQCEFGILSPRYSKMEIQAISLVTRTILIRMIIDPNCGYRSLTSGIPTR